MHDKDTIKELLLNYFKGSVSVIQKKWIDDWVNESPANEEVFYAYLEEWERKNPQYLTDTEQALVTFRDKSETGTSAGITSVFVRKPQKHRSIKLFLVASLTLFGLLFLGTYKGITVKTYRTGYGELATVTLYDGTVVYLNANSELKAPRFAFLANSRKVELTGEASFNVTHDPINKFIVQTMNGLDVVVHGTEFTVYNRRHNTEVQLKSGKVELIKHNATGEESIVMKPGEKVRMEDDGILQKEKVKVPEEFASWKQYRYVFDQTSLTDIARIISDNYGVEVEISGDSIGKRTLSGSFRSEDAKEFADAVAQVLGISMEIEEKRFRFIELD
ncbi:FecR family protein [Cyclobacterium qasimii]|uniref:Anti-sigma factor n=2 Tax=Cyclobacterium qasimii TaxID=1350429 RepID=A0A512C8J0_9BACT|nr:FecR domain-containing protein [Cyclobacterium qasimii]EPR71346.1 putative anti-sigma factor [Cyclobacterium qasimii M12-11B]GEO20525.1 anti-sigma factor [Cyclobacterium qasimii]